VAHILFLSNTEY